MDGRTQETPREVVNVERPAVVGLSQDTFAMMQYHNNAKSTTTAYLLWFFLGGLGAQRFYLGKTGTGILILICTLVGIFTLVPLIVPLLFGLYDLFTLPSQVRAHNATIIGRLQGEARR